VVLNTVVPIFSFVSRFGLSSVYRRRAFFMVLDAEKHFSGGSLVFEAANLDQNLL